VLGSKIPFEELRATDTITCAIGDDTIDLSTEIPDLTGIISIKITYDTNSSVRLKRNHIRNFDNRPVLPNGKPFEYARFGKNIEISPPPDNTYVLSIRYWQKPVLEGVIADTELLVPDAWLELIEWETFYRILLMTGRHNEANNLIIPSMQPRMPSPKSTIQTDMGIIPRLWNELLSTIEQREYADEDFSINPRVSR
jgi:hypothetical protein